MQREMRAESQTALIGTSCLLTLCQTDDNGIAPSLENAYAILIRRTAFAKKKITFAKNNQKNNMDTYSSE
jgi:hypothetical protein